MHYPFILIPKELEEIKNYNIDEHKNFVRSCRSYSPPIFNYRNIPLPQSPRKPYLNSKTQEAVGCLPLLAIEIAIAAPITYFSFEHDFEAVFAIILFCLGIWFFLAGWRLLLLLPNYLEYYFDKSSYQDRLHSYWERQRIVSQDKKKFDLEKAQYDKVFEEEVTRIVNSTDMKALRLEKMDVFKTGIIHPSKSSIKALKGISENHFLPFLHKYFGRDNVFDGYEVNFPGFKPITLYPDFAVRCLNGFYIDVEIDEPYTNKDKRPIHYHDKELNASVDSWRNDKFLDGGWAIIRFSEEQVVKYPHSCCKEIAKLYNILCVDAQMIMKFSTTPTLPLNPFWTEDEASVFALFEHREQYLADKNIKGF
jgi:hypothetical protein